MQAAKACNRQYPVVNYTLDIEGVGVGVISDSSDIVIATLSSAEFPGLYRDSKYLVSIGACNEFTCRESHTPLAICESLYQSLHLPSVALCTVTTHTYFAPPHSILLYPLVCVCTHRYW